MPRVSVVVPAYNEGDRIGQTLEALVALPDVGEVIVVDDGSEDETANVARVWTDTVIRLNENLGKGYALREGWKMARGDIVVFMDADLGNTAAFLPALTEPVASGTCDMAIARLPAAVKKGGFGCVKGLARYGVKRLTGVRLEATLSGQRAMRRELLEHLPSLSLDFGIEVGLTVESLRRGFRLKEVPVPFKHRESGRDWKGFVHRGRQFVDVSKALYQLWRTVP